jgi:hypothetical protein
MTFQGIHVAALQAEPNAHRRYVPGPGEIRSSNCVIVAKYLCKEACIRSSAEDHDPLRSPVLRTDKHLPMHRDSQFSFLLPLPARWPLLAPFPRYSADVALLRCCRLRARSACGSAMRLRSTRSSGFTESAIPIVSRSFCRTYMAYLACWERIAAPSLRRTAPAEAVGREP